MFKSLFFGGLGVVFCSMALGQQGYTALSLFLTGFVLIAWQYRKYQRHPDPVERNYVREYDK